jgi:hypothetical protein
MRCLTDWHKAFIALELDQACRQAALIYVELRRAEVRLAGYAVVLVAFAITGPACAKDSFEMPPTFQRVLDCQKIAQVDARIACYDQAVTALQAAIASRDVVMADRAEVQKTQRSLFGFALPATRLLGLGGRDDAQELGRIEATISAVKGTRNGWQITFAEQGTWVQTDLRELAIAPRVGNAAIIAKGALGSFTIRVDGQPPIKFRRIQ